MEHQTATQRTGLRRHALATASLMAIEAGRHQVVYADPPWPYTTYSAKGRGRSAEAHYDVMSLEAIAAMPVKSWAAEDAVLLLWTTQTILPDALQIIKDWGFVYKTIGFVWVKTLPVPVSNAGTGPPPPLRFAFGMGFWTRANPELCLLATRGKPHRANADVPQLLLAPRRAHSVKPEEIYPHIERLLAGPYLELFASAEAPHRDGWTRWVGKDRAAVRRWKSNSYPGADAVPPETAA